MLVVIRYLDYGVTRLVAEVVVVDQVKRLPADAVDPLGRRFVYQRDTQASIVVPHPLNARGMFLGQVPGDGMRMHPLAIKIAIEIAI